MAEIGAIIIEGHVQGLSNARALGEMGVPVYVVDQRACIASHSKYCRKFFQCPPFDSDQFASFLTDLAVKEQVQNWVLLPSNDHAVMTLSRNKDHLSKYFRVITPGWEVIQHVYDKIKLLEIAEQEGVPSPQIYTLDLDLNSDAEDTDTDTDKEGRTLTYPVITKGRFGLSFYKATGKKAFLSNDWTELRNHLKWIQSKLPLEETFTQEVIPHDGTNKTVSSSAFCVDGVIKTHWTGIKLREHPLQFGTATFAKSIHSRECLEQTKKLLKSLNYTGVCEVEYLQDPRDGAYKLIEMNARTWLWVGLARACGIDYAKILYEYGCGIPSEYPKSYPVDVHWRNPVTDFVYGFLGILKGNLQAGEYIGSLRNAKITNALFQKGDWKPGWAYIRSLLSFFKNR